MIVIPMAGLSSRFRDAGYLTPKYMLEAKGLTLFTHSLMSFQKYFNSDKFLFITLNQMGVKEFIQKECLALGVFDYDIITIDKPTRGQAETVYLGLSKLNPTLDCKIFIFNIDTFRLNFEKPKIFDLEVVDGYLETFIGEGANWSNILPEHSESNRVKLTAEKQEISEYCCTGLYYWKSSRWFCKIFEHYSSLGLNNIATGEFYIAPMYNFLIDKGADVRFTVINSKDVVFCGTPSEYVSFVEST